MIQKSIFFFALTISTVLYGQTAKISGKITDKENADIVFGAIVQIVNVEPQKVTQTDLDGFFELSNISEGKYKVRISAVGYQSKEIENVTIINGQKLLLDVVLSPQVTVSEEVVVLGTLDEVAKENVESLVLIQKKTPSNISTISADLMKKLPDRTSGEALKRVSGVSLQDGKYVIIRGLNERYNMAMLNGLPLASTESDRKAFSFDLIPANLLDNMIVYKTATPDLPADFAGGVTQVTTKDIPEENTQNISIGGTYNTLTTFKKFDTQNGGSYDFVGVDDGKRGLPKGIASNVEEAENLTFDQAAEDTKKWSHDFSSTSTNSARPSASIQYNIARRFNVAKKPTGILFALTYNNSPQYTSINTVQLRNPNSKSVYFDEGTYRFNDIYRTETFTSALLNFAIKPFAKTKIGFKNFYNISSDQFVGLTNANFVPSDTNDNNPKTREKALYFSSNKMLNSQISLEQSLPWGMKLKVIGGTTQIDRQIPDYRKYIYKSEKLVYDDGTFSYSPYSFVNSQGISNFAENTGRLFQFLKESNNVVSYDLIIPVSKLKLEFKVGGLHQHRNREVNMRTFAYDVYSNFGPKSIDNILVDTNFTQSRIMLREKETSFYNSWSSLHAFFGMLTFSPVSWFKIVGGVRNEKYTQNLKAYSIYAIDQTTSSSDLLPSVIMIVSPNSNQNIKASFSKTLTRPEFREMAPLRFYDYLNNIVIVGNPGLQITQIYNFDLKYEYFFKPGEFLAINPFYKKFIDPTELLVSQAEAPNIKYQTSPTAQLFGFELEGRKKILKNFVLSANYTFVNSEITINRGNISTRAMQGQSPFVFNASLAYENFKYLFDVSLSYNQYGDRIAYDGSDYARLVFERGRQQIDFQISKRFFKEKLVVRYIAGNILQQPFILYNDINADRKYTSGVDIDFNKTLIPGSHNLSLSYRF